MRLCILVEVCRHSEEYAASIFCLYDKRQQGSLKYGYIYTRLHGVISQITVIFIVTDVRNSYFTNYSMPAFCINEYSIIHIGMKLANTDLLTSKCFVSWQ